MLVSIVITTYKRKPDMVVRAINSVLVQTYTNLEIIVVDDSPSDYAERSDVKDAVQNICNKDSRVCYIMHLQNKGACAARNTGLKIAKGEFIAFLDDDDEWLPNKIEEQVLAFEKIKDNTSLVYCGCNYIDEKGNINANIPPFYGDNTYTKLLHSNFIGGTSFPLIRTNVIRSIGGFDDELLSSQDLDVWLRLSKTHPVALVEKPLLNYYIHEGEQITKNVNKIINGRETILKKNLDAYLENKHILWHYLLTYAYDCAVLKSRKKSLSIYFKAVRIKPFYIRSNIMYFLRIIFRLYIS